MNYVKDGSNTYFVKSKTVSETPIIFGDVVDGNGFDSHMIKIYCIRCKKRHIHGNVEGGRVVHCLRNDIQPAFSYYIITAKSKYCSKSADGIHCFQINDDGCKECHCKHAKCTNCGMSIGGFGGVEK